jgi:chemotaxis protein MotB
VKTHTSADAARLSSVLLTLALATGAAGCVSKTRYDDANAELRYYQRLYQDLESYQGKLEAENTQLTGENELYRASGPIEAGATADIDKRMEDLKALADRLGTGTAEGQVTVLNIDGGYGLRMPDTILFDSGSDAIRPTGRELLLRMAKEIQSRPHAQVWVRGHTDSDPVQKPETRQRFPYGNLQLSAARALEVAHLLETEGSVDQIVIAGFGPSEPVVPNDSSSNKEKNRRVEIFVLDREPVTSTN